MVRIAVIFVCAVTDSVPAYTNGTGSLSGDQARRPNLCEDVLPVVPLPPAGYRGTSALHRPGRVRSALGYLP